MNIFFSILSAVLLVLSFPSFIFSFLIWFALVPFFFLLDGKSPKAAFLWGWLTGFLFFLGTHYWLIHVTLPGMLLVNVYLGIYFGLFALGYAIFQNLPLKHQLWVLPSVWVVCEFLRDRLFTGFGWACLGHSQYQNLPLIQMADITGVFGVSFLVVMINVLLKNVLELPLAHSLRKEGGQVVLRQVKSGPVFSVVVIVMLVFGYGFYQLKNPQSPLSPPVKIAMIQPNVPQSLKWEPQSWTGNQAKILELTQEAMKQKPDLIIWPETSFPGYIWQSPDRYEEIKKFIARQKVPLLFGTVMIRNGHYYNSAILLSKNGEEVERYEKMHLVPFGEFLPFRRWLSWLANFAPIGDDFSRGQRLTVFPPGFSTLICFEDTVASVVRQLVTQDPGFLVNITNDGWFKNTNAPVLHWQAAVFQAVANRRTMIRAANTGMSGTISFLGVPHILKDRWGQSVLAQGIMVSVVEGNHARTFYTRFGDVFATLCFFAAGFAIIKRKILL